jgi:short-subunit dehydrogenase
LRAILPRKLSPFYSSGVNRLVCNISGPYYSVYAASKAFIQSFAEALRYEVKGKGVTITALLPGVTKANFFHRAHMDNTKAGKVKKDNPALVAKQAMKPL